MQRLKTMLNSIDHKGYPAYKGLKGSYDFGDYRLGIDKVQGDPFASPSRISLVVPQSTHAIPKEFYEQKHRRIAVEDHLLRLVCRESEPFNFKAKGSGKSGLIAVSRPGQEIVERSACHINAKNGELTVRMSVGFPANGRSINARELGKIFFNLYRRSCITPAVMRILTPKSYRELQTSQTISATSESRWRKKGILLLLPMDQCCRARMEYPNAQ